MDTTQRCRLCGCTDDRACPGGCYWVTAELCSACASSCVALADEVDLYPMRSTTVREIQDAIAALEQAPIEIELQHWDWAPGQQPVRVPPHTVLVPMTCAACAALAGMV